jgi:hypothetical protein
VISADFTLSFCSHHEYLRVRYRAHGFSSKL